MSVIVTTNEALSAAILDVLDTRVWYVSDEDKEMLSESEIDKNRLDLRDAVLKRLGELHVAPHNMAPQLENLCERHRREMPPKATVGFCGPCERELKAKLGHPL